MRSFHKNISHVAHEGEQQGQWENLGYIRWQILTRHRFPSALSDSPTYTDTGDKTVWIRGCGSGLEKRQFTAHITLFADRKARVKPLLMFRGKGKRISFREKVN